MKKNTTKRRASCSEIYKTVKNMPGWYFFVEDTWGNKAANYVSRFADEYGKQLQEIEDDYKKNELPKLKKEIKEWAESFPAQWREERRRDYLYNTIREKEKELDELGDIIIKNELCEILLEKANCLHRDIKRMNGELKHKWGDEITEQMIENARNYPIENLIDINQRGFAVCPFHDDKNPSAFCKNNFLYCFSCNESADPIKLYMHLFGCNFKTAILNLQQCSDTSPIT